MISATDCSTQEGTSPPLVRFLGLTKVYATSTVLDDVTFDIGVGSIHALVGENGAGKSTLIKLLTGVTGVSGGAIEIDGATQDDLSPSVARAMGIRVVPQERHVCSDMSVIDNVLLGRMPRMFGKWGPIRWSDAASETAKRLGEIGLDVNPYSKLRDLTVSEVQFVEVARSLSANARLVIMDEPTAALSQVEVRSLARVMRQLKEQNVSILYVSHHLEEVFELADTVTVLRNGSHVHTSPVEGLEMSELIRLMIGYNPDTSKLRSVAAASEQRTPFMRVQNVSYRSKVRDVSFNVFNGEVIAVTGGVGSGVDELAKCVIGAVKIDAGSVDVVGKGPISGPANATGMGVAFVSGDRKRSGLLSARDIVDNVDLAWLACRSSILDMPLRRERAAAEQVAEMGVVCSSLFRPIMYLSGGNQQKVLVGRWLAMGMDCLVLEDPTEGVDIGSRFEIYGLLRRLASNGSAVLIFSSDLEEIELVADRALVMRDGEIVGTATAPNITAHELLDIQYSGGFEEVKSA